MMKSSSSRDVNLAQVFMGIAKSGSPKLGIEHMAAMRYWVSGRICVVDRTFTVNQQRRLTLREAVKQFSL